MKGNMFEKYSPNSSCYRSIARDSLWFPEAISVLLRVCLLLSTAFSGAQCLNLLTTAVINTKAKAAWGGKSSFQLTGNKQFIMEERRECAPLNVSCPS